MQTLILPGFSEKNREWAYLTATKLQVDGQIRPIYWDHWTDPDYKFIPEEKANLISLHTKGDDVNIIAKSIGTLVASMVIQSIPKQIKKVILCGIPLRDLSMGEKDIITDCLNAFDKSKIICFQNDSDPHGGYDEVKAFLPTDIKVVKVQRADHEYPNFAEFNDFLKI